MKKIWFLILIVFFTGLTFSQSIGITANYERFNQDYKVRLYGMSGDEYNKYNRVSAEAFLEIKYIQAGVGYTYFLSGKYETSGGWGDSSSDYEWTTTHLSGHLFFKYPIESSRWLISPMIGVEYLYNLTLVDEDGNDIKEYLTAAQKDELDEFWIKGGVSFDYLMNPSAYFRLITLIGYKINSELNREIVEYYENTGFESASVRTLDFEIGAGIGFRF